MKVDTLRRSRLGSFLLDAIWFVGGLLLLWLPVLNPVEGQRIPSLPVRMIYLFLAAQLASLIPGGFLALVSCPLYRADEIAPASGSTRSPINTSPAPS